MDRLVGCKSNQCVYLQYVYGDMNSISLTSRRLWGVARIMLSARLGLIGARFEFKLDGHHFIEWLCWTPKLNKTNQWDSFSVMILCISSSFATILKRKTRWLLCYFCLTDVLSLQMFCGSSSWCRGLVCSVWLLCFLIILTYFLALHRVGLLK